MRRRRISAVLLILYFLLIVASSAAFIAKVDHDCIGENCPICESLSAIEDVVKGCAAIGAVLFAALTIFAVVKKLFLTGAEVLRATPVNLKVKLTN